MREKPEVAKRLKNSWNYRNWAYFQQDFATCHMSNSTKKFLKDENIRVLDWMPKGWDLSLIEHVWR